MIVQRFKELPRAAQWAIAAAIAVVVFLIYDAGVRPVTQAWNEKAEAMLDDFGNAAGGRQRERKLRSLREPMLALGGVVPPGDESQGNRALQSVVNDVLKRHTVSRDSFKYRGASKLPRGTLRTVVGSGQRIHAVCKNCFETAVDRRKALRIQEAQNFAAIGQADARQRHRLCDGRNPLKSKASV